MRLNSFVGFDFRKGFEVLVQVALVLLLIWVVYVTFAFIFFSMDALADGIKLPGEDASSTMVSAGTLMRFIDTGLFRWTARILAGLCILGAGWSFKEMRFGPGFISLISAILIGTAPMWVKNIFSLGGSDSVFSSLPSSYANKDQELKKEGPTHA